MKYIIIFLSCLAFIIACNTSVNKSNLLGSPSKYEGTQYTIRVDRDTTLVTANGALLKIPSGALSVESGNTATLEIKEAYSIEQMMKAGLTTNSNGEILSSGGMIYINAVGGQNVKITQAIKVAIPTNYLDKNMQLFKGEADAKGNINWKDPVPLPENKQLSQQEKGQTLFQSNCSNCHGIGESGSGPDLAHMLKRFSPEFDQGYFFHAAEVNAFRHVHDEGMQAVEYHHFNALPLYKCKLQSMFPKATGPDLMHETGADSTESWGLVDIYKYIQQESDRLRLPLPAHAFLKDCTDSCEVYKETVNEIQRIKTMSEAEKERLIKENDPLVAQKGTPPPNAGTVPPINFEEKVSPENFRSVYYQFTIESFGWYNVDVLIKGQNGVEESQLFVRIIGQYREKIQVYLIIPSVKIYLQGGPAERNNEEFAFQYKNGKIDLPQNAKAYIMAVTEREESIAFSIKEFTTSTSQEFELSLNRATKQEFEAAIQSLNIPEMKVTVADSKNADAIRKEVAAIKQTEEQLKKAETLKPKGCDCECATPITSVDSLKK